MGKARRWHYPFLTFPIRFRIRQSRRMGKARRWHHPVLTFPIRFSIRQPRRMGKVRRWHHPFLTFPIRFRIRQPRRIRKVCATPSSNRSEMQEGESTQMALSLFRPGSRDGLGKYALPPPTTGQDCRRGKARRWHHPFLTFPIRFRIRQPRRIRKVCAATRPLPVTGQRCRRGKARRWHRVLLLSPSYISTVPLSRPSRPSLSASLSPPIYTCAA